MQPEIKRSKVLDNIYPEEKMTETFGTVTPSVSDRTSHRNKLWEDWADNTVSVPAKALSNLQYNGVRYLQGEGLKDPFDYQCRHKVHGQTIFRFKSKEVMTEFKLVIAEFKLGH